MGVNPQGGTTCIGKHAFTIFLEDPLAILPQMVLKRRVHQGF